MKQFWKTGSVALVWVLSVLPTFSQTIATFNTSVGNMEVELFDDKPVTTANFVKYVSSGAYEGSFFHRWSPNFVIQGGGFYVARVNGTNQLRSVATRAPIVNEYGVGRTISNTYGTIAMAKVGGDPNSATSQWFFNLTNNASNLDNQNGGFTAFGKVISGTNVLNLFVPPPPTNNIYRVNAGGVLNELPVRSLQARYEDLIYVDVSLRREAGLRLSVLRGGNRQLAFLSAVGFTNVVEVTTNMPPVWKPLTNFVATSTNAIVVNRNIREQFEFYRLRVDY